MRKRAARHTDTRRRGAVSPSIQTLQLALHGGVRRLRFKRAFHVPDRVIEAILLIANQAHPHMRNKIARRGGKRARKNIGCIAVSLRLKKRFAQQPIDGKILRIYF